MPAPTPPINPDPLIALMEASISTDDALKAEAQSLVIIAIKELKKIMRTGAPSEKIAALKSFIPPIARALTAEHTDDKLADLKGDMQVMWAEMLEPYGMQEAQEQMEVQEDVPGLDAEDIA